MSKKPSKINQAAGPRGLRWYVTVQGRRRVVWAIDRETARVLCLATWQQEPTAIEPAPADYRNQPRGGTKTRQLAFRLSQEQLDKLHARYGKKGNLTENILVALLA